MTRRRLCLPLAAFLCVVTLPAAPAAQGPESSAPPAAKARPLPGSACNLPPDLESVTGHVLFRYRLNRKKEPKHIQIVYSEARPPEKREAFVEALKPCISLRATKGHMPDRLGSTRYLSFHFMESPPAGGRRVKLAPGRSLPAAWVNEVRAAKLRLARETLSDPILREHNAAGVDFISNADLPMVKEVKSALDFTLRAFDQAFPSAPPVPEESSLTLILFKSADHYTRLAAFDPFLRYDASGTARYHPWERIVYSAAPHDRPFRWTAGMLARDLARHLAFYRLAPRDKPLPYWVAEGVSAFFHCLERPARPTEGPIDLGPVERQLEIRGRWKYRQPGALMLEQLSRLSEAGLLPGFSDLGSRQSRIRAEEQIELLDSPSWIAVHFLLTSEGGRYRTAFQEWLRDPGNDKSPESLSVALDRPLPALDESLQAHIKATW